MQDSRQKTMIYLKQDINNLILDLYKNLLFLYPADYWALRNAITELIESVNKRIEQSF